MSVLHYLPATSGGGESTVVLRKIRVAFVTRRTRRAVNRAGPIDAERGRGGPLKRILAYV